MAIQIGGGAVAAGGAKPEFFRKTSGSRPALVLRRARLELIISSTRHLPELLALIRATDHVDDIVVHPINRSGFLRRVIMHRGVGGRRARAIESKTFARSILIH